MPWSAPTGLGWHQGALVGSHEPCYAAKHYYSMQHEFCISCTGERLDDQVLAHRGGDLKEARVPAQLLLMDSIFGLSDD